MAEKKAAEEARTEALERVEEQTEGYEEVQSRDPLGELLEQHRGDRGSGGREDAVTTVVLLTITAGNRVAAVDQRSVGEEESSEPG